MSPRELKLDFYARLARFIRRVMLMVGFAIFWCLGACLFCVGQRLLQILGQWIFE